MKREDFHPMRRIARSPVARKSLQMMMGGIDENEDAWREMVKSACLEACGGSPKGRSMGMFIVDELMEGIVAMRFTRTGRNIVTPTTELATMLARTDLGDLRLEDVKLPYETVYVAFPPSIRIGMTEDGRNEVDGVYLHIWPDGNRPTLMANITSRRIDAEDRLPWPHDEEPMIAVEFESDRQDLPIAEMIYIGPNAKAKPTERIGRDRSDETEGRHRDIAPAGTETVKGPDLDLESAERAISLAMNVIAYMVATPDDRSAPTQPDDASADLSARSRRADNSGVKARRKLANEGFMPVTVVGRKLSERMAAATGTGASPAPHWRRGHWRRQRYGQGLALWKPRWILPVPVNAKGEALEDAKRLYVVEGRDPGDGTEEITLGRGG